MDWKWLFAAWAAGTTLAVLCSPQRDAILWSVLPGWVHVLIHSVTGYVLVKHVAGFGRETYEWRRACPQ